MLRRTGLLIWVATAALALSAALGAAFGADPAAAGLRLPLRSAGRYLLDPAGRIVILHGLFAAWKQQPYFPAGQDDPANPSTPSFTAADAQHVRALGFDAVRLSWYWEGLEPTQGAYSAGYLNGIAGAEAKFASNGVYVILDAHQDQYDELFGNKPGFPQWSAITDGEPLAPPPTDPSYAQWKFPLGYFHPATGLAFGNLYANARTAGEGVRDAFGRAWQTIVRRFRSDPMVAGYDLINEPFPGTTSRTSPNEASCATAGGCAAFEQRTLEPFEVELARAIRALDRRRPVFFEPTFYFNGGVPNHFVQPPPAVRPVGLSFHNQCPTRTAYSLSHDPAIVIAGHATCPPVSASVFQNGASTATALGGPGLMTEVASTSDDDVQGLNCMLEQADRFQTGYTYGLSWSNPNDELRRLADESAPAGAAPFKQLILARVYPRAVAGTPEDYGFDVRTGHFWLRYRPRPSVHAPTLISVPTSVQYPHGYVVHVTGGRRVSQSRARLLEVANQARAKTVMVEVTPARGDQTLRPQFPACPLG